MSAPSAARVVVATPVDRANMLALSTSFSNCFIIYPLAIKLIGNLQLFRCEARFSRATGIKLMLRLLTLYFLSKAHHVNYKNLPVKRW
ncbi:MAG: hypothetical protein ACI9HY_003138 [Planctomycetaceae bacterium]